MRSTSKHILLWALAASAIAAETLPIINDDYDKARDEAKQRKLPMFVEVWAPW
ncbi:MAG TPA: hypothetical protein VKU01_00590 [Bryobacteraceae bacterium]|nr:hypothetical protein [Bryobacteraceae bacterium]